MLQKIIIMWVLITVIEYNAVGQMLRGKIFDEQKQELPFVNVYMNQSTIGATSNQEGNYALDLPIGTHKIVFQYLGYKKKLIEVNIIQGETVLDVALEPETYQLKEVVVDARDKNPAYRIIRQAIQKKTYYQREILNYTCQTYIKGVQGLDKTPKRIFGIKVPIDTGIAYLSESVSELSFTAPNTYKEKMLSSKVSGSEKRFSWNMAREMMVDFYENFIVVEQLNERGFISPLSTNAFFYYDYQHMGSFTEGEYRIHKIKVIPKRKNDPAFSGHIYIVDEEWRIHSVDLLLTKANQIEYIDSIRIKQTFTSVPEGVWVLLSQRFDYRLNIMGIEGNGYFIGVYSHYKITPKYAPVAAVNTNKVVDISASAPTQSNASAQKQKKQKKKTNPKEVMVYEKDANKRDTNYWATIRPIPLTKAEAKDYTLKDSIRIVKDSKPYKDSIDRINNKLSISKIFLLGYRLSNSYNRNYLSFEPIFNIFQYNTVEGFVANMDVSYTKYYEDRKWFRIEPTVRYGFSSRNVYAKISGRYVFNRFNFSSARASGGYFVQQFNSNEPITSAINTFESLLAKNNFMKLYEKKFVHLEYEREIANGLKLNIKTDWEQRKSLENTSNISLINDDKKTYTSNIPFHVDSTLAQAIPQHNALFSSLQLSYQPGATYIMRPDMKLYLDNKYPSFILTYKKGLKNILHSTIDYDFLSFSVTQSINYKIVGKGYLFVEYGSFLRNNAVFFSDFAHFNGNQSIAAIFENENYQLLDYYRYSTNKEYLQIHYSHHFNGFITNAIPLIKKTKVQLTGTFAYLYTPYIHDYVEMGLGLEHIFKFLRVDYFFNYYEGTLQQHGVRIGFGF